ncbi:MAG: sugar ABC transporter ATP-binding protein [Spirochaetales bacterium]|nr:sugar ABC transporter ATP-binding protein [Spirochaetales bacterium]
MDILVEVQNLGKNFLHSQALKDVNLQIVQGEILGIVGHNGAGKSTLVNILIGAFPPTTGSIIINHHVIPPGYTVHLAHKMGIRAVFQELSLCPNLTVVENLRVFHPELNGRNWKQRASDFIMNMLDAVFPDHGIQPDNVVEDLPLSQRQMLEIAKAFTVINQPLRLIILDEPTSALDSKRTGQLIQYLKTLQGKEMSCIYISHLLDEVLACTQRIVVMKDGRNVGILPTPEASRQKIIELMGEAKVSADPGVRVVSIQGQAAGTESRKGSPEKKASGIVPQGSYVIKPRTEQGTPFFYVQKGEIVGLAGLAGHGQTKLLLDLFDFRNNQEYEIKDSVTFIPGDRQIDGIFPVWSIVKNITVQIYKKLRTKLFFIDTKKEYQIGEKWRSIVDIKSTSLSDNILSLSGGNQQKVLFARCLESAAPLVLMDDPTRGVDVGTKEEIYKLILQEKKGGKSFVWYTTEIDELKYCDRVYVFKAGKIIAEHSGAEATEEEILKSSF